MKKNIFKTIFVRLSFILLFIFVGTNAYSQEFFANSLGQVVTTEAPGKLVVNDSYLNAKDFFDEDKGLYVNKNTGESIKIDIDNSQAAKLATVHYFTTTKDLMQFKKSMEVLKLNKVNPNLYEKKWDDNAISYKLNNKQSITPNLPWEIVLTVKAGSTQFLRSFSQNDGLYPFQNSIWFIKWNARDNNDKTRTNEVFLSKTDNTNWQLKFIDDNKFEIISTKNANEKLTGQYIQSVGNFGNIKKSYLRFSVDDKPEVKGKETPKLIHAPMVMSLTTANSQVIDSIEELLIGGFDIKYSKQNLILEQVISFAGYGVKSELSNP